MTINKRLSSSASTAFCMLSSKACRDPLHITAHLAPRPSLIQRELRTFRIFRQGEGSFPNSPLAFPAPPPTFSDAWRCRGQPSLKPPRHVASECGAVSRMGPASETATYEAGDGGTGPGGTEIPGGARDCCPLVPGAHSGRPTKAPSHTGARSIL